MTRKEMITELKELGATRTDLQRLKANELEGLIEEYKTASQSFESHKDLVWVNNKPDKDITPVATTPELTDILKALATNPELMAQVQDAVSPEVEEFPTEPDRTVLKCNRHPHINVARGESCEKCIGAVKAEHEYELAYNTILPCPKCQNKSSHRKGGTIAGTKTRGVYTCGNCQITYDIKGAHTKWGKGDQRHF